MKTLKTLEVWFVTGSQHLYGLDTKLGLIGIPPDSGTQIALTAGPLRSPGFPVELGGFGELHAAF